MNENKAIYDEKQNDFNYNRTPKYPKILLFTLKICNSVFEMVSALAMIGMILTLLSNFFMHTTSIDFRLHGIITYLQLS